VASWAGGVPGWRLAAPNLPLYTHSAETQQGKRNGETMAETAARHVRIAGRLFVLRRRDVTRALRKVDPEPIASHFIVVDDRRFPPKQVISAVTGLDRADFTTHQARRTLMRLGFAAGRRATGGPATTSGRGAERSTGTTRVTEKPLADRLRPLVGRWVAVGDGDVIHAANTPQDLVAWLSQHGRKAESVFRVPEDELAATGLAPL
jgi:hypothetical protein